MAAVTADPQETVHEPAALKVRLVSLLKIFQQERILRRQGRLERGRALLNKPITATWSHPCEVVLRLR